MSMKKKALMAASYVMVAALAVGGTVAYLTDTDSNVNTMTLGNVKIEQLEYERVENENGTYEMVTSEKYGEGYKVKEFEQLKPLMPVVGEVTGWGQGVYWDQLGTNASGGQKVLDGIKNVQDKFVLVENTGRSDAYVRTVIAFEIGDIAPDKWDEVVMTSTGDFWTLNWIGATKIKENNYYLAEFIYEGSTTRHIDGILPAGEISYNSLAQVYMRSTATNEDVEALDGNDNGLYDILVVSQAVQTDGFADAETALDAGFGDITTEAHPWQAATANVNNENALDGDYNKTGYIPEITGDSIVNMTITDETDDTVNLRAVHKNNLTGDLVIMDSDFDGTYAMNVTAVEDAEAKLIVSDTTFRGWTSYAGFESAIFANCKFTINTEKTYKTLRPQDNTVLTNCDFEAGYEFWLDHMVERGKTITFENCTIGGKALTSADQLNIVCGDDSVVVIK